MRESLYDSVICHRTSRMAERCGSLDKICRFCRRIAVTHLSMDVKFNTFPWSIVMSTLGLICRESTEDLELFLAGKSFVLDITLEACKSALFKLLLKAVGFFGLKECDAGYGIRIIHYHELGDNGLTALGQSHTVFSYSDTSDDIDIHISYAEI